MAAVARRRRDWLVVLRKPCYTKPDKPTLVQLAGHLSHLVDCYFITRILFYQSYCQSASVLLRCWLGGRKGIRPVKIKWWGAGMVMCLERGADLHMFQLIPPPLTISCFSKIQIGFAFLVPAHLGSPGKRAIKRVCVCVYCQSY